MSAQAIGFLPGCTLYKIEHKRSVQILDFLPGILGPHVPNLNKLGRFYPYKTADGSFWMKMKF